MIFFCQTEIFSPSFSYRSCGLRKKNPVLFQSRSLFLPPCLSLLQAHPLTQIHPHTHLQQTQSRLQYLPHPPRIRSCPLLLCRMIHTHPVRRPSHHRSSTCHQTLRLLLHKSRARRTLRPPRHQNQARHILRPLLRHRSHTRRTIRPLFLHRSRTRHILRPLLRHRSHTRRMIRPLLRHRSRTRHILRLLLRHRSRTRRMIRPLLRHRTQGHPHTPPLLCGTAHSLRLQHLSQRSQDSSKEQ